MVTSVVMVTLCAAWVGLWIVLWVRWVRMMSWEDHVDSALLTAAESGPHGPEDDPTFMRSLP